MANGVWSLGDWQSRTVGCCVVLGGHIPAIAGPENDIEKTFPTVIVTREPARAGKYWL